MAKAEKVLRVNVPFRVLPETLEKLEALAAEDSRTSASMFEKLVKDAVLPVKSKKAKS